MTLQMLMYEYDYRYFTYLSLYFCMLILRLASAHNGNLFNTMH